MFIEQNIFQMWISNRSGPGKINSLTSKMNFFSGELVMEIPVYEKKTEKKFPSPVVGRYVTVVRKNDDAETGDHPDGIYKNGDNLLEIEELEVFIKMPTIFLR